MTTNILISNANKEQFIEQATEDGEEIIVKILTIDVKKNEKFAGSSHPNRAGKQAAEKWHKHKHKHKHKIVWIWRKYGWKVTKKMKEKIRGWQKILLMWGQSLPPRLMALEKKETKLLQIYRDNGSYEGREHKAFQWKTYFKEDYQKGLLKQERFWCCV